MCVCVCVCVCVVWLCEGVCVHKPVGCFYTAREVFAVAMSSPTRARSPLSGGVVGSSGGCPGWVVGFVVGVSLTCFGVYFGSVGTLPTAAHDGNRFTVRALRREDDGERHGISVSDTPPRVVKVFNDQADGGVVASDPMADDALLTTNQATHTQAADVTGDQDAVRVLLTIAGNRSEYLELFNVVLRSTLLTTAMSTRPLEVHVMANTAGHDAVLELLNTANLIGSTWPCQVTITVHNVEAFEHLWTDAIKKTVNTDRARYSERKSIGGFYRLFPHDALGKKGHVLYLDLDLVVLADLGAVWDLRDPTKLVQWGDYGEDNFPATQTSGFMILNLEKIPDLYVRIRRCLREVAH